MSTQHSSGEAERARELFTFLFIPEEMGKGGRNKDEQSVFIMETTSHCSPREPCKIDPLNDWEITWGLEVCVSAMTTLLSGTESSRMSKP